MKRHAVTALCLLGALACYLAGWGEGIVALVVAGGVLELYFWLRVMGLTPASARKRGAPD